MFNLNSISESIFGKKEQVDPSIEQKHVKAFSLKAGVIICVDRHLYKIEEFSRDGNTFIADCVNTAGEAHKFTFNRTEKVLTRPAAAFMFEKSWFDSVCESVSDVIAPVVDCVTEGWNQITDMDSALDWKGCLVAVATWFMDAIVCAAIAYFFPACAVWLMIAEILIIAYKAYRLIRRYGLTNAEYLAA